MTAYGFTVWARFASTATCRHCHQRIIWRINRKTGKQNLAFNGLLLPLHTFIDDQNHQPMEVLSRDDLHFATCSKRPRPGRRRVVADGARA